MNALLNMVQTKLDEAGFAIANVYVEDALTLAFESDTVLGFVLVFPDAPTLLELWQETSDRVIRAAQSELRQAGPKSWNAYMVLLAGGEDDDAHRASVRAIEEDLVATRKIARAGISDAEDVREALLPLLSIQSSPRIEAVDMRAEILSRTTELPRDLVAAFLSNAPESTLIQILESDQ